MNTPGSFPSILVNSLYFVLVFPPHFVEDILENGQISLALHCDHDQSILELPTKVHLLSVDFAQLELHFLQSLFF